MMDVTKSHQSLRHDHPWGETPLQNNSGNNNNNSSNNIKSLVLIVYCRSLINHHINKKYMSTTKQYTV